MGLSPQRSGQRITETVRPGAHGQEFRRRTEVAAQVYGKGWGYMMANRSTR